MRISESECELNERHPINDIPDAKKLCLPLNEMTDVNLGQYYAPNPWLKFRFYTKETFKILGNRDKIFWQICMLIW